MSGYSFGECAARLGGTGSVPTFGCWLILAKRVRQVAELLAGLEQDESRARTIDLIGVFVATQV